jgi:hypothetical protein
MLTKLIGYEMKAFGRIILPLYAATIAMAIIMGVGIRVLDEELFSTLLGAVIIMIFVSLIIATMVMTGLLCVQRFYRNLLGNEGYLMFSLPVGTHQLILAKVLSSLIWALLGGVAGVCTVVAMGLAAAPLQETVRFFKEIHIHLRMLSLGKELGAAAVWFVILILFFVAALMQIYTAIAVGHQWTAHRVLGSVLAFFGIGMIRNIITSLLGQISHYAGWTDIILNRFDENLLLTWQIQAAVIVSTLLLIAVYSAVTWYCLDRRLNLE